MSSVLADYRPGRPDASLVDEPDIYGSTRSRVTRWLVLGGCFFAALTSYLPWIASHFPATDIDHPAQTIVDTGMNASGAPAAQFLIFATAALAVSWLRGVSESRTRTVQLMPAILGLVCLLLAMGDYQSLAMTVSKYRHFEPGFSAFFTAAIWIAGATLATSIWIVRGRETRHEPLPAKAIGQAAHAVSAGIGGIVAAIVLVLVFVPAGDEAYALEKIGMVAVGAPVCALVLYVLMTPFISIAASLVPDERSNRT